MDDEEGFLLDQLRSARMQVKIAERAATEARFKKAEADAYLANVEQAVVDYMTAHGLVKFSNCTLGKSESVDCPDINAVPEEYIRVKEVREVNKALIRAARPAGNWYTIKETPKLTIKGEAE